MKKKLVSHIREKIPQLMVRRNFLLLTFGKDYPLDDIDTKIGFDNNIKKELFSWISETPIKDFVGDWLAREIYERPFLQEAEEQNLAALKGLPTFEQLSSEIVDDLLRMPYDYKVFYPLPRQLTELFLEFGVTELGDGFRLTPWSDALSGSFPQVKLRSEDILGDLSITPNDGEADNDFVVLERDISGCIDRANSNGTSLSIIDGIRTFFGLCLAVGLVRDYYANSKNGISGKIFVFKEQNKSYDHQNAVSLSQPFVVALGELAVGSTIKHGADRVSAMSRVVKALSSEKSERILLASRWLFDSIVGDNQLLSFIQTTVSLEILLGDQKHADQLSINDILSNRCAYMLGRNNREREKILKGFKSIYSVRSEIVHRGKSRLSKDDLSQFYLLTRYCSRVIAHEIDLLDE